MEKFLLLILRRMSLHIPCSRQKIVACKCKQENFSMHKMRLCMAYSSGYAKERKKCLHCNCCNFHFELLPHVLTFDINGSQLIATCRSKNFSLIFASKIKLSRCGHWKEIPNTQNSIHNGPTAQITSRRNSYFFFLFVLWQVVDAKKNGSRKKMKVREILND
jgi:hypothetical protein